MKKLKTFCYWDLNIDFEHENQIELYIDQIPQDITPKDTIRFVCLIEPTEILDLNQYAINGMKMGTYNFLLTHNEYLLKNCPNSHLFEFGTTWIKNYSFPKKEYSVSTLVGGKLITEGHHLRHKIWFKENRINKIPTNFFISGTNSNIENYNNNPVIGADKSPLFNSQFYICIENVKKNNWFTEKLMDCFQTKTIPIYWGCPNIGNWFDTDGMIIVNSLEDVITACNNLDGNYYESKIDAINKNFELSNKFVTLDDRFINKINELI